MHFPRMMKCPKDRPTRSFKNSAYFALSFTGPPIDLCYNPAVNTAQTMSYVKASHSPVSITLWSLLEGHMGEYVCGFTGHVHKLEPA